MKALVVEGDRSCRQAVQAALENLFAIDEVAAVASGREGLGLSAYGRFDIIVLDAELPDMLGRTLLLTLKLAQPDLQIVVVVDEADVAGEAADDLHRCGARIVIARPGPRGADDLIETIRSLLCSPRNDRAVPVRRSAKPRATPRRPRPAHRPQDITLPAKRSAPGFDFWATAIAVSTGGPVALDKLIPKLPATYPLPILVVQHMPPLFTEIMARDLDAKSAVKVVEANDGDRLEGGTVYLAPGGKHMTVRRIGDMSKIALNMDPPLNNCRPSANVLFRSLSEIRDEAGILAVVMTGMGDDGCEGVRLLKAGKCHCLTQSAGSCVVYGMPRAVKEAGLSDESVTLHRLDRRLVDLAGSPVSARC
ncbi:response regulator [bacterium]|nr:response regulator [bacterium]MBU1072212.1 response regulator [bacterium]MBU1675136.1 response regulator [bacterium]